MAEVSSELYTQVLQLSARYYHAIDLGDVEAWVQCYVPGGQLSSSAGWRITGHDDLRRAGAAIVQHPARHYGTSMHVWLDDGVLRGRSLLQHMGFDHTGQVLGFSAFMEDTLLETDEGVRYRNRHLRVDAPFSAREPGPIPGLVMDPSLRDAATP